MKSPKDQKILSLPVYDLAIDTHPIVSVLQGATGVSTTPKFGPVFY